MADHDRRADGGPRIFLRPLGNPLPLGFLGLAGATITLAGLQLHWVPAAQSHQVGLILILYPVPAQLIASVLAFLARDAPTGAAMGVLAATWLTIGTIEFTGPPGSHSQALGLLLFLAAAGMLVSALSVSLGKLAAGLVLATTALRFATSGVSEYTRDPVWSTVTGWVGVALCVLALYAALAIDLEDLRHHAVLPMLRSGRGRKSVSEGLIGAGGDLEREPGVREQL
jgi:succinate-acetate transporter protein